MKFKNFTIVDEPYSIEIEALGVVWDLHNVADFLSFTQDVHQNSVVMKWQINQTYALQEYPADKFELLFSDVNCLEISPRDKELPHSEDDCVASISRVPPSQPMSSLAEHEIDINQDETFHLVFAFQSEQRIRIGAQMAEFRLVEE
ncbi:MAG: hypothetical protein M3Y82_04640 [Verrucomicrobiota bacterium]|nr:hypothetical protein [Verrucomicrobiota bacterium]